MKIGILQTGHVPDAILPETGDYDDVFRRFLDGRALTFEAFAVVDGVFPDGPDAADGWLITGSRHGAYDDLDWIAPLETLIQQIDAAAQPLVGICFGHQIIAQALGGKVEKFAGGWAVGATEYRMGERTLTLNAWHQDQITELPGRARVLAGNAFCRYAVVQYDDHIWTVQAHPEFDSAFLGQLIRTRGRGLVPDDILEAALARIDSATDSAEIAGHIAGFLTKARG